MSNSFFDPGSQRATRVNDLFAAVAPRYDLINDLQSFGLHRLWKRRLVRLARVSPGERALDLCCGTGDIAFGLARRGAGVVGLDFNPAMLAVARTRASERGGKSRERADGAGRAGEPWNPHFLQGDAQRIPFPDNSFEIVTVGYGLRNLESWERGLGEMRRVAKPGGRLLVLDFGKPDNAVWRAVYFSYLNLGVPVLGRVFCGNAEAYAYIFESLKHYPAAGGLAAKMRELGLKNVRILNLLGGMMSIHCAEKPQ
jgi:demethylmenaquinone methyltransferase / 2-methoxy-6-polyprenyl-1,4-benzoquinol methylase